ncbi:MAG: hypothetical protein P8Z37_10525, partial [Acidobacteriota bacterium]
AAYGMEKNHPTDVPTIGLPQRKFLKNLSKADRFSPILLLVAVVLIASIPTLYGAEKDGRFAIILVGVSGDPDLQEAYLEETRKLHTALVESLGFPRDQIVTLFDNPELDPDLIQHKSTRKDLEKACLELSGRVQENDLVFVFIEGHGSYDGKNYKLNLVGPDPNSWELAEILYSIPAGRFIVVNATNSSGGSLPALSGNGKIVITATKSGMERNQSHMGRFFVESLEQNAADANKDDRISVLESFLYANRKVEDFYKNEGNLQTEHAILDDNGDREGQSDPTPESKDGLLARTTFFDNGIGRESIRNLTPERQKLLQEARDLENRIEALKYDKAEMPQSEYEVTLEELLLELAKINAKLQNQPSR